MIEKLNQIKHLVKKADETPTALVLIKMKHAEQAVSLTTELLTDIVEKIALLDGQLETLTNRGQ